MPSGTTTFAYDETNRLRAVTEPGGGETNYTYDVIGNLLRTAYPNHTRTDRSYDSLDRIVRLENRRPDSSIMSGFTYALGPIGNRLSVTEDGGRSTSYSYDSLYRLTQERTTELGTPDRTTSYTYDRNGNRTAKIDSATGVTNYVYDANDRLLTENGQAYAYDANGNQLVRPDGSTLVYDFENRLIQGNTPAGTLRNTFDVDGDRVRTDVSGTITNYLVDTNLPFSQVLEERDGARALKAQNVFGLDLIRRSEGGQQSSLPLRRAEERAAADRRSRRGERPLQLRRFWLYCEPHGHVRQSISLRRRAARYAAGRELTCGRGPTIRGLAASRASIRPCPTGAIRAR